MTRARRGYSLLELLVILALLGTAMTMITVSLHGLYRAEARMRGDLEREHALEQFVTRWRWDAHEATAAQPSGDAAAGSALTMSLADSRTVIYAATPQGIERTISRNDEVVQRDMFLLGVQPVTKWEVTERPGAAASLTLHLELPGKRGAASQSVDFTAALGMLRGTPPLASLEAQ